MSVGRPDWYASTKRRPFISVYPNSIMLGTYVASYSPDQRLWRESKILRGVGLRPAYRINIRFHDKGSDWLRRRAARQAGTPIADCPYTPAAPPDSKWGVQPAVEWLKGWHE